MSARLARAVSTADTALIVFYTSLLQSGRAPPAQAVEKRVKEAPVQLRVVRLLQSPSPSAVLAECRVLKWAGGTARPHALDDVVTVVFRSLPTDCPRVGRTLDLLDANTRAGVWFPATEVSTPQCPDIEGKGADTEAGRHAKPPASKSAQQGSIPNMPNSGQVTAERADLADREDLPAAPRPVLFASRYLLVS